MLTFDRSTLREDVLARLPDAKPSSEHLEPTETTFQTEWVYRYAERPTDETCPGWLKSHHGQESICRMCGRTDVAVSTVKAGTK